MNKEAMIKITEPEVVSKIEPIENGATGVIIYNYDKSHVYYKDIDLGSFEELLNVKKYITDLQQEIGRLNNIINTMLEFNLFAEECPLNFGYTERSNEEKAQDVFYEDDYCEKNCNDEYKKCWLKYFERLQELKGSDKE